MIGTNKTISIDDLKDHKSIFSKDAQCKKSIFRANNGNRNTYN
jgi:hypothetical protein